MAAAGQAIAAGMHQLARVFFHVQALNADGFEIGILAFFSHFHLNPAVLGNGLVELGNLIVLGQVGIEILLAIELAVGRHL